MLARATVAKPKHARRSAHAPIAATDDDRAILERLKQLELPERDGVPLESDYHVMQIPLLDDVVRQHWGDTRDYFCGGNMFIYYSLEQAQDVIEYVEARYKGPDFFLVKGVDGTKRRGKWVVWEENGRYPDLIIEVVSPSTRRKDERENKRLYARVFRTPEYFMYDRVRRRLVGYRLAGGQERYRRITPDARGWLWSEVLQAYLGVWEGEYHGRVYEWLRLYDADGNLIPTHTERAENELRRLRAVRQERGIDINDS
ncbi:MAG: Uma2 family endonuclease [Fimbriimonadales bacterium]